MPIVTNKKTGIPYTVTDDEMARIKRSPYLTRLFKYEAVNVPDEVVALKKQMAIATKVEAPEPVTKKRKPKAVK